MTTGLFGERTLFCDSSSQSEFSFGSKKSAPLGANQPAFTQYD